MAVKQEVLRMGLRRVKWICFPHSLPVGCGKNIIYYTAIFPQKNILWGETAAEKVENQHDHPGVAAVNELAYCRVICHGDDHWLWASPPHNITHQLGIKTFGIKTTLSINFK